MKGIKILKSKNKNKSILFIELKLFEVVFVS